MKNRAYYIIFLFYSLILIIVITSSSWTSINEPLYKTKSFYFEDKGDSISAVINYPNDVDLTKPFPLLIFVHGDGPTNADNFGYYTLMWEILAKNGIATMSWNKKGVENSSGNWLNQSMLNRAEEVLSAIDAINKKNVDQFSSIGLIGFSQAGWVLPKVAIGSKYPDYMIFVSSAINWKKQSNYLTKIRLEGLDKNNAEIIKAIAANKTSFSLFEKSYEEYLFQTKKTCEELEQKDCIIMSSDRFYFIKKNINSDNSRDLEGVTCPIFAMFGEDDLNVDSHESYAVFQKILSNSNHQNYKLKMYPNATHGLLKSNHFNTIDPGIWFLLKMNFLGGNAFVENVLQDMVQFIDIK